MLAVATVVLAGAAKLPELALAQQESEAVAGAGVALLEFYGFGGMSKETQLWANLAMISGGIAWNHYGAYGERKYREHMAKTS